MQHQLLLPLIGAQLDAHLLISVLELATPYAITTTTDKYFPTVSDYTSNSRNLQHFNAVDLGRAAMAFRIELTSETF